MLDANYPPPVAALLSLGSARAPYMPADTVPTPSFEEMQAQMEAIQNEKHQPPPFQSADWPDYRQFGIGPEHIADLLAMVQDETLSEGDPESSEAFAPIHAWRALGQLRATEAIEPLIALFDEWDDWDYFTEEMPDVLGLIGPAALPALTTFLNDANHLSFARGTAARAIGTIGRMHPEARETAVATITDRLAAYRENDEDLTTTIIGPLLDLEAVESLPVIREAYAADAVDLSWYGDLEDVELSLGVREARDTPRPRYNSFGSLFGTSTDAPWDPDIPGSGKAARRSADKKAKAKRKMAEKSRRKNRKRK